MPEPRKPNNLNPVHPNEERAMLVAVDLGTADGWTVEEQLEELRDLAMSAGARVVNR